MSRSVFLFFHYMINKTNDPDTTIQIEGKVPKTQTITMTTIHINIMYHVVNLEMRL